MNYLKAVVGISFLLMIGMEMILLKSGYANTMYGLLMLAISIINVISWSLLSNQSSEEVLTI